MSEHQKTWTTEDQDAPEGVNGRIVSFRPADNDQLLIRFRYRMQDDATPLLYAICIEPGPELDPSGWQHIDATLLRDLPLGAMKRAARYMVIAAEQDEAFHPHGHAVPIAEIPGVAREMIRVRFPDLGPDTGAGAARRWRRLVRLAEIALEYQAAQSTGEKNPSAVVAAARNVAESTVRGWLHQAKREGMAALPLGAFSPTETNPR